MRAKKHLGQNFLTSKTVVEDIIEASEIDEDTTVLEVGPGKGVLTARLLDAAKQVVAVEKDPELLALLQEKFAQQIHEKRLTLIEADILELDITSVLQSPYKLVANIPYYITGAIIRQFLSSITKPSRMTLLLQKEVAHRIVARDGKESILSISVKAYGTPKYVERVPARYFSPKPKVDSAILVIRDISKDFFREISEDDFFAIVKTGFQHKRKLLAGNLGVLYPKDVLARSFESCRVSMTTRAEELALEDWKCLCEHLNRSQ